MAYQANIPQPTDQLSQSQSDILNNFMELNTTLQLNHVFDNTANSGKHNFLQMPVQGGPPTTSATEMALYTKTSALTLQPEMFIRRQNNTLPEIEFTAGLQASNGWTYLPSGLLIKWGSAVGVTGGTVNFVGPNYTTIYNAQVSIFPNNVNDQFVFAIVSIIAGGTPGTVGWRVTHTGGPVSANYTGYVWAIGV